MRDWKSIFYKKFNSKRTHFACIPLPLIISIDQKNYYLSIVFAFLIFDLLLLSFYTLTINVCVCAALQFAYNAMFWVSEDHHSLQISFFFIHVKQNWDQKIIINQCVINFFFRVCVCICKKKTERATYIMFMNFAHADIWMGFCKTIIFFLSVYFFMFHRVCVVLCVSSL